MKKLLFTSILLAIMFLAIEVLSYVAYGLFHERMFSHKEVYLSQVHKEDFLDWIRMGEMFDDTLGWDLPAAPAMKVMKNCLGDEVKYSWKNHARNTKDLVDGQEIVGLFGDSYAHGDEIDDEFTVPSVLTSKYNIPTKNFGVGGFGPTQAFLKFERMADDSKFKIAVLQIMHENIRRMPNSYRPVYNVEEPNPFSLKPFTHKHAIHRLGFPEDWEQFQQLADEAFEKDFWNKPAGQFPYSLSFVKAFWSNNFKLMSLYPKISKVYYYEYHYSPLREDLEFLIHKFYDVAHKAGKIPLVVFVPQGPWSHQVADDFAAAINRKFDEPFVYDTELDGIDWDKYNLKIGCHPSKKGYALLAKVIADIIQDKGMMTSGRIGSPLSSVARTS